MTLSSPTTARPHLTVWSVFLACAGGCSILYAIVSLGLETGNAWPLLNRFMLLFGAAAALTLIAWRTALRLPSKAVLLVTLGFALLFRLLFLPAGLENRPGALVRDLKGPGVGFEKFLLYDNDIWRFVWDGHVANEGVSPYRYSPEEVLDDDSLAESLIVDDRWYDVLDHVSFGELPTIYPPVAQGFFAVSHLAGPGSIVVFKGLLIVIDLTVCWLLAQALLTAGRHPADAILYAWCPLVLKEVAGSGHIESLTALFVLGTALYAVRGRPTKAAVALAAAILTKVTPIVLVPALFRRFGWRVLVALTAAGALACLPFLRTLPRMLSTARTFAARWEFNSGPWDLLYWLIERLGMESAKQGATVVSLVIVAAIIGRSVLRERKSGSASARVLFVCFGAYLLFSPTVMPWYLIPVLPLAILASRPGSGFWNLGSIWMIFGCLSLLSYYFYAEQAEYAWWRWVEFGFLFVALGVGVVRRGAKPRRAVP